MKVVGVLNNKGGVGKTLLTRTLAEYWALEKGYRVLLIDMDSQCSLSNRFLPMDADPADTTGFRPPVHPDYDPNDPDEPEWDGRSSIADIFYGDPVLPYPTYIENLQLAPGWAARLLKAEQVTARELELRIHNRLRDWLDLDEVKALYDIVAIDTAPSKTPTTMSALRAATHVILPTIMDTLGIEGLYGMLQAWAQENALRSAGNEVKMVGIIPNMVRISTAQDKDMLDSIRSHGTIGQYVFESYLAQHTAFKRIDASDPTSILKYPPSSRARQEAVAVCEEAHSKVFDTETVSA